MYTAIVLLLPASTSSQCIETREGISGLFGKSTEKCFEIKTEETRIDYGIIAGGKSNEYLLESQLEMGEIIINMERLSRPNTIEQLQNNLESISNQEIGVEFR